MSDYRNIDDYTTDAPRIPGQYWWRDKDGEQRLFNLRRGDFGMMLWYRERFGWVPIPDYGEWIGPIARAKEQP